MSKSTVSILLPVRNNASFLAETIQSLTAQTFTDWECLAIDDGSEDESGQILRSWAANDSRVRVLRGGGKGIVAGLNLALAEAQGEWIARMDGDDIAHPTRLKKQLNFMQAHPEVVACGTQVRYVDPKGRLIFPTNNPVHHAAILEQLERGLSGALIHPALMARTRILKSVEGYREAYRDVEDLDLYLRLSERGKLANVNEFLLDYRQHPKSANVLRRERQQKLRLLALNDYRARHRLEPLKALAFGRVHLLTRADLYADWALKAAQAAQIKVAYHYALMANLREFWNPQRWPLFWQVFSLGRRSRKFSET